MNYKIIFRNQKIRFLILKALFFVPDKIMLRVQYFIKLDRKLNFNKPFRFTEKIQVYKLTYKNPEMLKCVDKYKVREFVTKRGCSKYLNTIYGVFKNINDVKLEHLPESFVIKSTDGGGGENIHLCKNKNNEDFNSLLRAINRWKNKKVNILSREWAFSINEQSNFIIEKYLYDESNKDHSINDYKFFCFNGEPRYIVVDIDRYSNHKRDFFDLEWNPLGIKTDCSLIDRVIKPPTNYKEMINVVKKLSEGFPFVRVDLYNIRGEIIFGEMTFYPWSGYVQFTPDEFDFELGKHFCIK